MMRRVAAMVVLAGALALAARVQADELIPAVDRPEILEVGEPLLISRKVLAQEMKRNIELRDWVRLYGAPDYTEVQEVAVDPPFAPYEVRLYYLKRDAYLAFGRVNVAPNVYDYGVRKYIGAINPAVVDRLLTAHPAPTTTYASTTSPQPEAVPPIAVVVETVPVDAVPVSN
jgi:hypothetical protein